MKAWKSFSEGFIGAFALAGAIVMAIVAAASAFVHSDPPSSRRHDAITHF
jgi:hypothetical protein